MLGVFRPPRRLLVPVLAAAIIGLFSCSSLSDLAGGGDGADASTDGPAVDRTHVDASASADAPGDVPDDAAATDALFGDAPPECAPDADFSADPANCGACGHDCLGGACAAGRCQPVVLAAGETEPFAVTADPDHVFWLTSASFRRCAQSGCADAGAAIDISYTRGLVVLDASAYVSAGTSITRIDDALVTSTVYPTDGGSIGDVHELLAVDGGILFASGLPPQGLWWLDVGARVTTPIFTGADAGAFDGVQWLTVTTNRVFLASFSGWIRACTLPGCAALQDIATACAPYGIAHDDAYVYWADACDGGIRRCALPDCSGGVEIIQHGEAWPVSVRVDGASLAWVNRTSGEVVACDRGSCASTRRAIATGQSEPISLFVDERAYYWTNHVDGGPNGAVVRLAK